MNTPLKPQLDKHGVCARFLLRLLLCPLIFIWGCVMLVVGSFFPLPLIVMISFWGLLFEPFIWLLRKSGANIKGIEPFFDCTGNNAINHFLGLTIYVWGAFAIVYFYLKDGTVWTG